MKRTSRPLFLDSRDLDRYARLKFWAANIAATLLIIAFLAVCAYGIRWALS